MCLPAAFGCLERDDIEDYAIGREEGVEGEAEVALKELVGEVGEVEGLVRRKRHDGGVWWVGGAGDVPVETCGG